MTAQIEEAKLLETQRVVELYNDEPERKVTMTFTELELSHLRTLLSAAALYTNESDGPYSGEWTELALAYARHFFTEETWAHGGAE